MTKEKKRERTGAVRGSRLITSGRAKSDFLVCKKKRKKIYNTMKLSNATQAKIRKLSNNLKKTLLLRESI